MFSGLRSILTDFNQDTIYLDINTNEKWNKNDHETCLQIAKSWRSYSAKLINAKSYQIRFRSYKSNEFSNALYTNEEKSYRIFSGLMPFET